MPSAKAMRLVIKVVLYLIYISILSMLKQLKRRTMAALPHLHLFKHSEEGADAGAGAASYEYHQSTSNFVLMVDGFSSLSPIPVDIVTAAIKISLPIVKYGDFLLLLRRRKGATGTESAIGEEEEGKNGCVVCWECVEGSHQMRDLPNCRHVFHRECLDRWVDEGQITCPLCRSMLLPPMTNPWAVLRDSNANGEEESRLTSQERIPDGSIDCFS